MVHKIFSIQCLVLFLLGVSQTPAQQECERGGPVYVESNGTPINPVGLGKDAKDKKVDASTEPYIVVLSSTTKPGTKIEIVGLKPTFIASAKIGALPKPEVDGNIYLFRGRELRLRPSALAGKLNIFLEGTVSSIVVVEVPEGVPIYFGKRPAAPEPAKKGL